MITDYIEMTASGTPLLMTETFNLSVTVVGQFRKDPGWGSEDARGLGLGPQYRAASGNL